MESLLNGVSLVVFLPLLGMLINLFLGQNFGEKGVGLVAVLASGSAFIVSLVMMFGLIANNYHAVVVNPPLLDGWITIPAANVDIPWQFRVDSLSVIMMLVVSGVGTLIHIYAIGYMHGDSRFQRFFVYLNLFLFFMMILVTGNNMLMMFVGWEGVGLCSFLLIGFWFDKDEEAVNEVTGERISLGWKNSNAARKAFIANRVGDFGVLMAIFLIFWTFGTLDFYKTNEVELLSAGSSYGDEPYGEEDEDHSDTVIVVDEEENTVTSVEEEDHGESGAEDHGEVLEPSEMGIFNQTEYYFEKGDHRVVFGSFDVPFLTMITIITLFMLIGATGKSAQIPLFVWLPDAMAGPTPVSALIHAATMVTAGVYMMVRSNSFFYHADLTSFIVTMIGCATAIMAGFVAVGQWDVKRVLAYSTVSQLGFMVAAVGLGAYTAAMFHLVTHAVFKALLFLGSGSIIHGMEHGHHHLHDHHGHDDDHGHEPHDEHGHDPHHGDDDGFDPQDMRFMGGLRKQMPLTYWTYLFGTLALAGVFPFAGFWSKDEILADGFIAGWENGELKGFIALLVLMAAAAFTAFYMWRQVRLVFHAEPRHEAAKHADDGSWYMWLPLQILGIGALAIGFINIPSGVPIFASLFGEHVFADFLEHSVVHAHAGTFFWWLALGAVGLAVGAIIAAQQLYSDEALAQVQDRDPLQANPQGAQGFAVANAKMYWDEIYYRFIEVPYNRLSRWFAEKLDWDFWHDFMHENILFRSYRQAADGLSTNVDRGAIDQGIMFVTGRLVNEFGSRIRHIQTGYVRTYALTVVLGVVAILAILFFPIITELLGL